MRKKKLVPIVCEICEEKNTAVLHKHHIIERTDPNTTNDEMNLAIVCSNCHNKIHANQIKIIGIYPSTKLPYQRTLVYEVNGVRNIPEIKDAYYKPKPNAMKVYQ